MTDAYKIKVIKADTGKVVKTLEAVTERAAAPAQPAEQQARYSRLHDADALHGQQLNVYGTATTTEVVTPEGGATTEAALGAEQAAPKAAPGEPFDECFPGEPRVAVPQGLISAACSAIRNKRDGGKVLEQLRRYSVGDLSQPLAPQPAPAPLSESIDQLERDLAIIGVVGVVDGHDVVRRESVLEIARRAALAAQGGRDA